MRGARFRRALHALVRPRALGAAHLGGWSGIGRVAVGMHRQGYDRQLTQYDERGWRATFYTTGWSIHQRARNGHGRGAHGLARDAAGGVGGRRADDSP